MYGTLHRRGWRSEANEISMAATSIASPLLPLFQLSQVIDIADVSILHVAVGEQHMALATSNNLLLLYAAAEGAEHAPLLRQMQWFVDPLKSIASMAMRDDDDLLVASHDASAFVLPLRHMLRRQKAPVVPHASTPSAAAAAASVAVSSSAAASCSDIVAVHAVTRSGQAPADAAVSCCALCDIASEQVEHGLSLGAGTDCRESE